MLQETVINKTETSSSAELPQFVQRDNSNEEEMDLMELGRVVLRNKLVIFKFAIIAAVLTAITVLLMKPYYNGAGDLPASEFDVHRKLWTAGAIGSYCMAGSALGGLKDPSQIYVGILGSRSVADDLIKQFDLQNVYKTRKLSQTERILKGTYEDTFGKGLYRCHYG